MEKEIRSEIIAVAGRLITINQFDDIADLDIPKYFGKKRRIKLAKRIEAHNDNLKRLAIRLTTLTNNP